MNINYRKMLKLHVGPSHLVFGREKNGFCRTNNRQLSGFGKMFQLFLSV